MQKVYLLLRNNRQSGPHSLEELLQAGLRPMDLIWVEGKSSGWSYPSEIEALRPYAPAAPATVAGPATAPAQASTAAAPAPFAPRPETHAAPKPAAAKKIHVILPGGSAQPAAPKPARTREISPEQELERKAEELRQRAQAYNATKRETAPAAAAAGPALGLPEDKSALEVKYTRSIEAVEEEYTDWMITQKTRRKRLPVQEIGTLLMVLVLLAGGYVVVRSLLDKNKEPDTATVEAIPYAEPVQKEQEPAPAEEQGPAEVPPLYDETAPAGTLTPNDLPATAAGAPAVSAVPAKNGENKPATKVVAHKTAPVTAAAKAPAAATTRTDPKAAGEPAAAPTARTENKKEAAPATATAGEKKSLGQKIDNFLGRFKREKQEETVAAVPRTTQPETAVDEPARQEPSVPLSEQVDLSSNQPSGDNWMMGVQGLKLTLHNRSSQTVQNAAVEVRYYNDQNSVVKRTTVRFSNIPAKKSGTIAVPDERVADHADFRIVSVSGAD